MPTLNLSQRGAVGEGGGEIKAENKTLEIIKAEKEAKIV